MPLLEEIACGLRLPLSAAQVSANAGHQLGATVGTAFAASLGPAVLIEQFIRSELLAVAWPPDPAQARFAGGGKLRGDDRAMRWVTIDNQMERAGRLTEQVLYEADEQPPVELAAEHHEGQVPAVRVDRHHVAAKALPGGANNRGLTQELFSKLSGFPERGHPADGVTAVDATSSRF